MCELISSIFHPSIIGAITGALIAHFATKSRDKESAKVAARNRLLKFRGFIKKCRCHLYRAQGAVALVAKYNEIAPEVAFECGLVGSDICDVPELVALCSKADSFQKDEYENTWNHNDRSSTLTQHMDKIVNEIDKFLLTCS